MNFWADPIFWRGVERLLIVLAGILCFWIGYLLLRRKQVGGSDAEIDLKWDTFKLKFLSASPGLFCVLFGAILLGVSLVTGRGEDELINNRRIPAAGDAAPLARREDGTRQNSASVQSQDTGPIDEASAIKADVTIPKETRSEAEERRRRSIGVNPIARDDEARPASERISQGTRAAFDAEGVRDILATVTEAALTEGGLDDLVERLVDADRNRIGDAIEADVPDHANLVKQFRADWKAKYGQEFDISEEERVFPDGIFAVTQGEIAAGNVATVAIKESHVMPPLTVPLVHESPDNWRIDVPDTLTAAKLRSNIIAGLQAAHSMKDQWPTDVQDAYAVVSRYMLMAILDQPVQGLRRVEE